MPNQGFWRHDPQNWSESAMLAREAEVKRMQLTNELLGEQRYRQRWGREAEFERSKLANALLQEKLNQEEQERKTKQMFLDMMQGQGASPSMTYRDLTPAMEQALQRGERPVETLGAVRPPEVGPEGVSGGTFYSPSRPYPSQPQTQGLPPDLLRKIIEKVFGLHPGETPKETLGREREIHELDIAGRAKTQESMDVRQRKLSEDVSARQLEREQWKEGLEAKRGQLSLGTQLLINRSNSLDQQEQRAQTNRDVTQARYRNSLENMMSLGEGPEKVKARQRLLGQTDVLRRADYEYDETVKRLNVERKQIKRQLDPIMQQLGIPLIPEAQAVEPDPVAVFDEYMRGKLDPHSYTYFNTSGADARMILQRAKAKGVTPQDYLEALTEVRKRDAKKSR